MTEQQNHVALSIPGTDTWAADFGMCLVNLVAYTVTHGVNLAVNNYRSTNWLDNRYHLIKMGLSNAEVTHFLFFDHDMVFPNDAVHQLLARDKDIVGAVYPQRKPPFGIVGHPKSNAWDQLDGLVPMFYVGFGVCLIRRQVFEAMKPPYFHIEWRDDEGWSSDDPIFCRDARDLGYEVYADMDISRNVAHQGIRNYACHFPDMPEPVETQELLMPASNLVKKAKDVAVAVDKLSETNVELRDILNREVT